MKKLQFPRDEQAHKTIVEWWYWNGHLIDQAGNRFAFMTCLFGVDPTRVKLAFFKIPSRRAYFSHSLLVDLRRKKNYQDVQYLSLVAADSFSRDLLFVNYIDANVLEGFKVSVVEETAPFEYRLKGNNFDLTLAAVKKPLLEGGEGYLAMDGRRTYYYSLTNLRTEGFVTIDGKSDI